MNIKAARPKGLRAVDENATPHKLYGVSVNAAQHNSLDLKSIQQIRAEAKARLDRLRKALLSYRLSSHTTLIQLEKLTGIPKSTIADLESSRRPLRAGTIRKIESFLEKVNAAQAE